MVFKGLRKSRRRLQ